MTQKDLLYIKTIAEEGGISQAARKLYLSQPSLSQSLKRIEDSLGTSLFRRIPKGLVLTEAGREYYLMANQILKTYSNFEEGIQNLEALKTGRITVGVTTHRGLFLLPEFLADFHLRYPGITVTVMETTTGSLEELLLSGTLDFAFMRAPSESSCHKNIAYQGLVRDSFLLLLPPGHPAGKQAVFIEGNPFPVLELSGLKDENFLLPDTTLRLHENVLNILDKAGIPAPKSDFSSVYVETLVRLVAAGCGVSILPHKMAMVPSLLPPPEYFCIPEEYGGYWEMCIATLKESYLSKAAVTFIKEFRSYLGL